MVTPSRWHEEAQRILDREQSRSFTVPARACRHLRWTVRQAPLDPLANLEHKCLDCGLIVSPGL